MKRITFNKKWERVDILLNKRIIWSYVKNKNLYYFSLNKLDKQILLFEQWLINYLLKNYLLYKDFNIFIENNFELSICGKFYVYNWKTIYQSLLWSVSGIWNDLDDRWPEYYEALVFEPKESD
ncbi:MAG: hypothetical protein ACD_71C00196G0004 [uncultured bacterium (gcode 4)]|uniref:Uncharacterized protein n=1 Tax=uncultured bacterium (gcode 4) TaxID=1234023 RepID=K1YMR2_9BACT|nr:MAG: hypothetical protein ACD_71C00196G0004 [uncultured bacterium (gcode 4)]